MREWRYRSTHFNVVIEGDELSSSLPGFFISENMPQGTSCEKDWVDLKVGVNIWAR